MACLLAWCAFEIYEAFTENSFKDLKLYKTVAVKICLIVISFIAAIIFVNIITLLMGGTFIPLKQFLFPLLNPFIHG